MYLVMVDDPGTQGAPERRTTTRTCSPRTPPSRLARPDHQLDTPLDPISGNGVRGPGRRPRPARAAPGSARRAPGEHARRAPRRSRQITHPGRLHRHRRTGTGATGGRVTLTDVAQRAAVTTLTRANGGIVSWTPGARRHAGHDRHPRCRPSARPSRPGRSSSTIVTANANGGGVSSVNGITVHVLGTAGGVVLQPDRRERRRSAGRPHRRPHPAERDRRARRPAACSCSARAPTTRTSWSGSRSRSRASAPAASSAPTSSRAATPRTRGSTSRAPSSTAASSSRTPPAFDAHASPRTRRTCCRASPAAPEHRPAGRRHHRRRADRRPPTTWPP